SSHFGSADGFHFARSFYHALRSSGHQIFNRRCMMAILLNRTRNSTVANRIEVATTFFSRLKGLLGRNSLGAGESLRIDSCSSIHTFFMRFAIDALFVDKSLTVKKCVS